MTRGAIFSHEAYAQGKMIDHSGWTLPRKISPSDIDAVIADGKKMLLLEFSSQHHNWNQLIHGQRRLYQDLIVVGQKQLWAVLLKHSVPKSRQIRSDEDIESFQLMLLNKKLEVITSDVIPCAHSDRWMRFVHAYFEDLNAAWKIVVEKPIEKYAQLVPVPVDDGRCPEDCFCPKCYS